MEQKNFQDLNLNNAILFPAVIWRILQTHTLVKQTVRKSKRFMNGLYA